MQSHARKLRTEAEERREKAKREMRTAYLHSRVAQVRIFEELNRAPNSPASKRVTRIIELFNRARTLRKEMIELMQSAPGEDAIEELNYEAPPYVLTKVAYKRPHLQAHHKKFIEVLRELHTLTSRYCWHPVLRHIDYLHGLEVVYENRAGNLCGPDVDRTRNIKAWRDQWENVAIFLLTRNDGEFAERVRRCANCGKWFFAVAEHQKYCVGNCRQRGHAQGKAFKQKRQRYMKNYRKDNRGNGKRAKDNLKGGN